MFKFVGRIASDIEIHDAGQSKVATVRVAVDRPRRNGEEKPVADFHNVTFWNRAAEIIAEKGKKGASIFVEGYIQNRSYEKDGQKRTATDFVAGKYVVA